MKTMRLTEALERAGATCIGSITAEVKRATGMDNPTVTLADARRLKKLDGLCIEVRSSVGVSDFHAFCKSRMGDWGGTAPEVVTERLAVALEAVLAQAGELIVDEGYDALKAYYAADAQARARVRAKVDALIAREVGS